MTKNNLKSTTTTTTTTTSNSNNNSNNKVKKVESKSTTATTTTTTTTKVLETKSKSKPKKLTKRQMEVDQKYKSIRAKCNVPKSDWPEWRKHLYDHGWAVVKNVVPKERCEQYSSRFWDWVESFNSGVKRDKPNTWTSENWPGNIHGIFQGYAVGQSQFIWDIRSEEEIIKIFEMIYQDKQLLVSFDGCNLSRPTIESRVSSWAHFDQGSSKFDFRCIQGFLNLQPCQENDGGLIVYEDSHLQHDAFFKESGEISDGDWYKFKDEVESLKWFKNCKKIKVCCDPGDIVLWDSRTIHYACPPIKHKGTGNCREVVYVSYQPAIIADEKVLGQKQKAFYSKRMTSHWAAENIKLFAKTPRTYGDTERERRFQYDETTLPVLTPKGRQLAGLDPY